LETAVDAIITIDARGLIQSANPATERMFGYPLAELIGQNVKKLMPAPFRAEHDGYLQRYLETGERRIIGIGREVIGQREDGSTFSIDLAVSEVEPGRLFTGIIRDLSERKLAEARLRAADRMAAIGSLAAGLGHDMNHVLLPMRAFINAASAAPAPEQSREHLKAVRNGIAYLQQLADGLYFLAMDSESGGDDAGTTNIVEWWGQAGLILSKGVPKHVKVEVLLPTGLPLIAVAPHALTQAMLNLVVNAGEAITADRSDGSGVVRIWADCRGERQSVRLCVTDNGAGMTGEVRRRALDMFFTTKPRGLGTGLGLAMVHRVVTRAGGAIHIESEANVGTTVYLELPVVAPASDAGEALNAALHVRNGRAASLIQMLLEAEGVEVCAPHQAQGASVCFVDPATTASAEVQAWRSANPGGKLVLVGTPDIRDRSKWEALSPVATVKHGDFEAIREAVAQAVGES
jgi:PAS domain S-box-containing protein